MIQRDAQGRIEHRLTYELNGQVCYSEFRPEGEVLTRLYSPSKPYHTFSGWQQVPHLMPDHDLTLYGEMTPLLFRAVFAFGVEQYGVYDLPYGAPLDPPNPPLREGYDFVRWEGLLPTMPAENRVFEAVFVPRTYQITFCVDDDFRSVFTCRYGDPFPSVDLPQKEHHTFSGWSEHPDTVPAHDVVVSGTFSQNLYRLTRVVDGETFSEEWLPYDTKIDKKKKPQREGYYFSGWRKLPTRMPAENVTVSATMYPTRYRVDFIMGDEKVECIYVPYGSPITPPRPRTPQGEELYVVWEEIPETMPARDLEIRGSIPAKLYTLIYMADGMELYRTDLPEGSPLPQNVDPPEREGYTFRGWKDEPDAMPGKDTILEAAYATALQRYIFKIDDEVYTELDLPEGESLTFPSPAPRNGYAFSGWDSMSVDPETGVITYSGSYGAKEGFVLTFKVRGDVVSTKTVPAGAPIVPPVLPLDPTYRFEGWIDLPEVMPAKELTIEARVRVLRYRLRFSLDGKIIYTMSLREGTGVSCPAVSRREGYTFSGWQDVPKRMPLHDCLITGTYIKNSHTVTYLIDDEVLYTATVPYGDPVPVPKAPDRPGETFVGWDVNIPLMPDKDLVIHGSYSTRLCHVRFYVDGLFHSEAQVPAGSPLPLPEISSPDGESFTWQDAPSVATVGTIDVHGGHSKKTYTITYLSDGEEVGREMYAYGEPVYPQLPTPQRGGETFLLWEGLPKTMPSRDLTVKARYTSRYVHITFQLEGEVYREYDVACGTATPDPQVEERAGYHFSGWHNWAPVVPDYNFTVYGAYTRRTYTVTYLYGDTTVAVQEYRYGERIFPPASPNRQGAIFRGWEGLTETMPPYDLTVSARYGGNLFTINYYIDGILHAQDQVEFGSRIKPAAPPERDGYTFMGWRSLPEWMPDREISVRGTFERSAYSVTYKVGGIIYRIDTYERGAKITPPTPPEHDHEVFVRWRNFTDVMPDYDFTCQAEYADAIRHYSFVLDGVEVSSGDLRKGEDLPAPTAPEKEGYTFAGWREYTGVMPGKDVTYAGSYVPNNHYIRYLLDGELFEETLCRRGEGVVPPEPPRKTGYLFSGWQKLPAIMPDHDVTAEGYLIPRKYRLTYIADATAVFDEDVPCGTPLGKISAPEIHGSIFEGWSEEPSVMPAEAVTITGSYRSDSPRYKALYAGDAFGGSHETKRVRVKTPRAVAVVSGSTLRLIIHDICYPVEGISNYIRNGVIINPAAVAKALHKTYRENLLPRTKLTLLFHLSADVDRVYEAQSATDEALHQVGDKLFGRGKALRFTTLSQSKETDSSRTLISAIPQEVVDTYETVFRSCGVKVEAVNTLFGGLTAYLNGNKKLNPLENQLCLFYLSNGIVAVLLVRGQVALLMENRYPYPGALDYLKETDWFVAKALARLNELAPDEVVATLIVGGIEYDRVRRGKARATELLSREIRGGKISGGRPIRSLRVKALGLANTENRI